MTPDITLDSVAFVKTFDDATGSVRRDTTLGLQYPRVLTVKHQESVDSKTKEQKVRSLVRFDYSQPVGTPAIRSTDSVQIVFEIPESSTPTRMQEVIDAAKAALASSTFITSILNREI